MLLSVEATGKKQMKLTQLGVSPEIDTLYVAKKKKTWTKPTVCWGIVRRNHMLVLHISGRFLLNESLRWRSMSVYIYLFIQ